MGLVPQDHAQVGAGARGGLRELLASLVAEDRATRFDAVERVGKVRKRKTATGKGRWFVDLRPFGQIYSVPGSGPIETKKQAVRILRHVQGELSRNKSLDEILAVYVPISSKPLRIETQLATWMEHRREQEKAGDLSPTYLRELERYSRVGGHFSWWCDRSVLEITAATLDDWELWLRQRERTLSAKTRRNVLGAFRAFMSWLHRRRLLKEMPPMPVIRVAEHSPALITLDTQDAILNAISEPARGIFLAMARLGIRPSEARALDALDYAEGWLTISKATKGGNGKAPIRGTKTGKVRRLPVPPELAAWLAAHPSRGSAFNPRVPLFRNPKGQTDAQRWHHSALDEVWRRACKRAGVPVVGLYEGTKHAFATDAAGRGVQGMLIQRFLGHSDIRSTQRYAKLADAALRGIFVDPATSQLQNIVPLKES